MPTIYVYSCFVQRDAYDRADQIFKRTIEAEVGKWMHKFPGCEWGGLTIDGYPQLKTSLWKREAGKMIHERLQAGDVVMFWEISRCFTDVEHLVKACEAMQRQGVRCVLLDLGLTIGTTAGDAVFAIVKRILQLPVERWQMLQPME